MSIIRKTCWWKILKMTNWGEKVTCSPLAWFNICLRGFQHKEKMFTIQAGNYTQWCEVLKRSSAYSVLTYSTRFIYVNNFFLSLLIFPVACILEISALNSPPLMVNSWILVNFIENFQPNCKNWLYTTISHKKGP